MRNSEQINIAIIGLGWVATNRHIPLILRNPHLHLFGIVDKHTERIQRLAKKYAWLKTSVSKEGEMPWGDDIQAVLIATDPRNHYLLAKKTLLAGKHVLMEKPFTMKPEEGRELLDISTRMAVSCCVVHNFQFSRSTLKLQKMLQEGRLGKIRAIEGIQLSNPLRRLPLWYEKLPFGLFYDESPHMFYMLQALSGGDVKHISSTVLRTPRQNTPLSVTGHYISRNIPIRLSMNFDASLSEWHIAVIGTKGVGIIDIFRDILVTMPNDGIHRAREIVTSSGSFMTTHLWGFLKSGLLLTRGRLFYGTDTVWEHFIKGLQGKHIPLEISAARGLQIIELQHELMNKSKSFDLSADENSHAQ